MLVGRWLQSVHCVQVPLFQPCWPRQSRCEACIAISSFTLVWCVSAFWPSSYGKAVFLFNATQWTSITKHQPHTITLAEHLIRKHVPNPYCQYATQWELSKIYYMAMLHSHFLLALNYTKQRNGRWRKCWEFFKWAKSCLHNNLNEVHTVLTLKFICQI